MPPHPYLRAETHLALGHRALFNVYTWAVEVGLDGLEEDLNGMLRELERLQLDLLRAPGRLPNSLRRRA